MSPNERVRNWVLVHRWYRQRGRCFSLEGGYKAPRGVEIEYENGEPPPRQPEVLDVLDAWEVELAWRTLKTKARWVLKYHCHDRLHPELSIRLIRKGLRIRIKDREWRMHVKSAKLDLRDALELRDFMRNNTAGHVLQKQRLERLHNQLALA